MAINQSEKREASRMGAYKICLLRRSNAEVEHADFRNNTIAWILTENFKTQIEKKISTMMEVEIISK